VGVLRNQKSHRNIGFDGHRYLTLAVRVSRSGSVSTSGTYSTLGVEATNAKLVVDIRSRTDLVAYAQRMQVLGVRRLVSPKWIWFGKSGTSKRPLSKPRSWIDRATIAEPFCPKGGLLFNSDAFQRRIAGKPDVHERDRGHRSSD